MLTRLAGSSPVLGTNVMNLKRESPGLSLFLCLVLGRLLPDLYLRMRNCRRHVVILLRWYLSVKPTQLVVTTSCLINT